MKRIHIIGASGSGTTTLAKALCKQLNYTHFDSDDYYWVDTDPPYQVAKKEEERVRSLKEDMEKNNAWVLSGCLCGWGDGLTSYFDLVVYISIPKDVRMARLKKREEDRFGDEILPGHPQHGRYVQFMDWAGNYDEGDMNTRSKQLHDYWTSQLDCAVLKIDGDVGTEERVKKVIDYIEISKGN